MSFSMKPIETAPAFSYDRNNKSVGVTFKSETDPKQKLEAIHAMGSLAKKTKQTLWISGSEDPKKLAEYFVNIRLTEAKAELDPALEKALKADGGGKYKDFLVESYKALQKLKEQSGIARSQGAGSSAVWKKQVGLMDERVAAIEKVLKTKGLTDTLKKRAEEEMKPTPRPEPKKGVNVKLG